MRLRFDENKIFNDPLFPVDDPTVDGILQIKALMLNTLAETVEADRYPDGGSHYRYQHNHLSLIHFHGIPKDLSSYNIFLRYHESGILFRRFDQQMSVLHVDIWKKMIPYTHQDVTREIIKARRTKERFGD